MAQTHQIISLASKSPRRRELLDKANILYELIEIDVEESYPSQIDVYDIPEYLAEKKAKEALKKYPDKLILTADSVVIHDKNILEKPKNEKEAINYLKSLSNSYHEVITGFCLSNSDFRFVSSDNTGVYFNEIPESEIKKYIHSGLPFDKAGGYGIQDWLGIRYIYRIEGSYENVMGLPIHSIINSREFQSRFSGPNN